MAGLALAGAGVGAAAIGGLAATGNLPVSKQQQVRELEEQGLEAPPELKQEAEQEQLAMLGAALLAMTGGGALGAGVDRGMDWMSGGVGDGVIGGGLGGGGGSGPGPVSGGSRKAADPETVRLVQKLGEVSPEIGAQVQAILDRKAGKAPPLRVEATPLADQGRFAGSPAFAEAAGQLALRPEPTRGQRMTADDETLRMHMRRLGEHFENNRIYDQIGGGPPVGPIKFKMTPAEIWARQLGPVGEAASRVSREWIGKAIDAIEDYEKEDNEVTRANMFRVRHQNQDPAIAMKPILELGRQRVHTAGDHLYYQFDPVGFGLRGWNYPMNAEELTQHEKFLEENPRGHDLNNMRDWEFIDDPPIGFKKDLNWDALVLLSRLHSSQSPLVTEDDRKLANALSMALESNRDPGRWNFKDATEIQGALLANDIDGWLDMQAHKAHYGGWSWQEPELPVQWRSPAFYEGFKPNNEELHLIDLHNKHLDENGIRGFRERLRRGFV